MRPSGRTSITITSSSVLQQSRKQDRKIGTVKDVMHTKANDILVIEGAREVLVPMTEDHIVDVSMEDGLVRVREDGLVE